MVRVPYIQEQANVGCGVGFAVEPRVGESHGALMRPCVVCAVAVCFVRGCGLVLVAEVIEAGFLPCAFLCLARDGPCNGSVRVRRIARPSTVNHTTTVVCLCEDTDHQACQTSCRLGTLAYTPSFEVGSKVTALRGGRYVDDYLGTRCSYYRGRRATTTPYYVPTLYSL